MCAGYLALPSITVMLNNVILYVRVRINTVCKQSHTLRKQSHTLCKQSYALRKQNYALSKQSITISAFSRDESEHSSVQPV